MNFNIILIAGALMIFIISYIKVFLFIVLHLCPVLNFTVF